MSSYGSRGPPDIDGMVSLKVDNLTYRTTTEDLRRAFQEYGDVGDVYIPRDRFSRESRGFAFVRFFKKKDAEHAMDSLDGKFIDGRQVRCQMARYGRPSEPYSNRRERGPPRRGYDRYGGSSRRRSRSRSRSPRRRSSRRSRSYSSHSHSPSRSRSRSRGRQASRSRSRSYEQNGAEASD